MKFPNDEWVETSPHVYQRKEFTPEQLDRLRRRPDAMISAALRTTPAVSSNSRKDAT